MAKRDTQGRWLPGTSANQTTQFQPGMSGNPTGLHRLRREFEAKFTAALFTGGDPTDAVEPLWKAIKKGEPWAQQLFWSRLCPQSVRLEMEQSDEREYDLSKLSDAALEQLEAIVQASRTGDLSGGREVPALSAAVRTDGMGDH